MPKWADILKAIGWRSSHSSGIRIICLKITDLCNVEPVPAKSLCVSVSKFLILSNHSVKVCVYHQMWILWTLEIVPILYFQSFDIHGIGQNKPMTWSQECLVVYFYIQPWKVLEPSGSTALSLPNP